MMDYPVETAASREDDDPMRIRVAWVFVSLFAAAATAYLLLPLRDTYREWNDFRWIYVSGKTWLAGASPYDFPRWAEQWIATPRSFFSEHPSQPFLYPPHWAVLAIPAALLPYGVAIRVWDVISVIAVIGTMGFVAQMVAPHLPRHRGRLLLVFLIGVAAIHGSLRWSIWESQLAVVPMFGVVGAFAAWRDRDTARLAFFAFLAALKPQVGALPLLFLLFNGGHRGVLIAGAAATAVSIVSLAPFGLANVPSDLADCYARHMNAGFNQKHTFSNLSAVLATIRGGERFFWVAPALAGFWLVGVSLWRRAKSTSPAVARDPLVMLMLVGSTIPALLPLHGYDLVVITPLVLASVLVRPRVLAIAFVLLVQLSGRVDFLERRIGIHPLLPFLTVALMLLCVHAVATHTRSVRDREAAAA